MGWFSSRSMAYSAKLGGRNITLGILTVFLSWDLCLSVVFRSVSAIESMSGTLEFLVWRSLSGSILIVVVSSFQPSEANVLVPTEVMLCKIVTLTFFQKQLWRLLGFRKAGLIP